ncbi:MAG: hypothetical protein IKV43_06130 [Clostridia bacterium]|nr:hypothetical protein [Clostridia bacterium]
MFSIGEKVVYGAYGVMEVIDMRDVTFDDRVRKYYVLREAGNNTSSETLVPMDNEIVVSHMKRLLTKEEMIDAIRAAKAETDFHWPPDNRARAEYFKTVIASGDRVAILVMIRSVIEAGKLRAAEGKKNFLSDETAMRKAEKVLYSEIALVMEIPLSDVVRFIENV